MSPTDPPAGDRDPSPGPDPADADADADADVEPEPESDATARAHAGSGASPVAGGLPRTAPSPRRGRRRRRRSRRWRLTFWGVVAVVVLWALAAATLLALGLVKASHGMAYVQDAKDELSASDVVSRSATAPLQAAAGEFDSAGRYLHSVVLAPLDIVPVIGRQLRSVQDLSSASAQVAEIGTTAIAQAHDVLHDPHSTGPERLAALHRLAALAASVDARLGRIDTGPSGALLGPLASKRNTFVRDLDQVRTRLQHASAVAGTMAGILQGPKTYLLLMANNAEMRAGSGAFEEVGVLTADDGEFHLSDTQETVDIPVAPGKVAVTGDLEARWGYLHPGQDWRNLGLTPQFDVNAPLAARMWEAETGQHIDGVLAVDVDALQQFLQATGPVTLPDGTVVSSDDVVQLLVHDQYEGLSDLPATAQQAEAEAGREEQLGTLAKATLDALQDEPLDLTSLSDAMTGATQGRHLLAWSEDPSAESTWVQAGVAGQLTSSSTMVALINQGGNKLDQYLSVSASLSLDTRGGRTDGTLTVDLANHTPPGQSQFIAGPYPGIGTVYGQYVGALSVNLPGFSYTPRVVGAPRLDALGAEGPTWLVATPVDVRAGQSQQVVVTFTIPEAHGQLSVVPTARLDPVTWHYRGATRTDATPFTLSW